MTISIIGAVRRELKFAILILLTACAAGCNGGSGSGSHVDQPPISPPRLIRQGDGMELLQLQQPLPGLTLTTVQNLVLPGVLETTGQITFDDRRVANIISRVTGRIEQVYVSQWDYVRRGQPIITLYSPDFMTAEAEYLQAEASAPALTGGPDNDQFAHSMVEAARRKMELLGIEPQQIARIRSAAPVFTMYAPISGNVVQNQALRGSAVNPGDILYFRWERWKMSGSPGISMKTISPASRSGSNWTRLPWPTPTTSSTARLHASVPTLTPIPTHCRFAAR